ncbi:MAG: hypothetical protein HOQ24_10555 [Mycobacteriaceae bacterium]|nr:hypothetical protein [Mycobacteriaceae bacterium]
MTDQFDGPPKKPGDEKKKSKITITSAAKGQPRTQSAQVTVPADTSGAASGAALTPAESAHVEWLIKLKPTLMGRPKLADQWRSHRDWTGYTKKENCKHYFEFDTPHGGECIWRFTGMPTAEKISIEPDVSIEVILELIGEHSGGNKKDDPRVQTSSFCRNLGALIGTAASSGGDKNVLTIVNKAPYLCCVNLASLRPKGISAIPALARSISLFETEYVLVCTPGARHFLAPPHGDPDGAFFMESIDKPGDSGFGPPQSIIDCTYFVNPFKGSFDTGSFTGCHWRDGRVIGAGGITVGNPDLFAKAMANSALMFPDVMASAAHLDPDEIAKLVRYAGAVAAAAGGFTSSVQNKEAMESVDSMKHVMADYVAAIYK